MNMTVIGRRAEMSPKTKARMAGVLLVMTLVGGAFAQGYVAGHLIVAGNAAATANNIVTHESLYRLGFAVYMVEMACQMAMTVLFYDLLKPVNRMVSTLAAVLGLVGCTIKTMARLFFFAPLLLLNGAQYLAGFDTKQLQAMAMLSLRANYTVETMAMVFFGMYTLVKGYLYFKSTFLPRALGVLSMVCGIGWLLYLYEPLARRMEGFLVGLGMIGVLANVAWLLIKGVDEQRWSEEAKAEATSIWR